LKNKRKYNTVKVTIFKILLKFYLATFHLHYLHVFTAKYLNHHPYSFGVALWWNSHHFRRTCCT